MEWPKSKFYFVFSQITSLPSNVPDSQVLVEKIVRLQKELAKRQEKLDFMEEHVGTMVEEMKKKNKLLQILMLKQDAGALASEGMDTDKVMIVKLIIFWKTLYLDTTFFNDLPFSKKACYDKECTWWEFRGIWFFTHDLCVCYSPNFCLKQPAL